MVEDAAYMTCEYCRGVSVKKYHNTLYPYCGNCSRDFDGEKIYLCNYCRISEPANRMMTEGVCQSCADRLDIYEPSEKDPEDLKAFIARLQRDVPALQDAKIEYQLAKGVEHDLS